MKPITQAGIVLGLGLGGFVDGIVAHQILGWHHLVCTTATCQVETVEALKTQVRQDGYFHLGTLLLTMVGIGLLFRAGRSSAEWHGRGLVGGIVAGWGLFHFVEGVIDHHLLAIHHLRPGHPHQLLFDLLFLAAGLLLIATGGFIARSQPAERN